MDLPFFEVFECEEKGDFVKAQMVINIIAF
jgi:hypothetical protein